MNVRHSLALTVTLAAAMATLPPAEALAARYYDLACRGPLMSFAMEEGDKVKATATARAGTDPGRPQAGQCVWRTRAMDRPGENKRGVIFLEFRVPRNTARLDTGADGKLQWSFPGHRTAQSIWRKFQSDGPFTVPVRRIGNGRYDVALTQGTRNGLVPSDRIKDVIAAQAGSKPRTGGTVTARPAPSARSGGTVTARPAPSARSGGTVTARPAPGTRPDGRHRSSASGKVTVGIKLERVKVYKDGDSASPGDWILGLTAGVMRSGRVADFSIQSAKWPKKGARNVKSGRTYRPDMEIFLRNINRNDWITIGIGVVDCDSDGPLDILDVRNVIPTRILAKALGALLGTKNVCRGEEEIFEVSGDHDVAGKTIEMPPQDWRRGRPFSYVISGNGLKYKVWGRIRILR